MEQTKSPAALKFQILVSLLLVVASGALFYSAVSDGSNISIPAAATALIIGFFNIYLLNKDIRKLNNL